MAGAIVLIDGAGLAQGTVLDLLAEHALAVAAFTAASTPLYAAQMIARSRLATRPLLVFRLSSLLLGVALPVGTGLAAVSPEMARVFLGGQWGETVPIIRALAPITAILTLELGVRAVVMIQGDTRILFLRNLAVLAALVPGDMTFLCTEQRCLSRWAFCLNMATQRRHAKGFSPVCTRKCVFRFQLMPNCLPQ